MDSSQSSKAPAGPAGDLSIAPRANTPAEKHLDSGTLFAGGSEVVIAHGSEIYRLRLTRQNRLILTK